MTAVSHAPGMPSELFAESARNSGGLPSEETIARWLCAHEGHTPEQVDALWTEWMDNARELLGMFRPAFEAKEREVAEMKHEVECTFMSLVFLPGVRAVLDTLPADDDLQPLREKASRALSAEAKLAELEREIERLTNNRDMWKGQCDRQAETIRQLRRSYDLKCSDLEAAEAKLREANMQALSDEGQMRELQAKLARAVEALGPFASYMNDGGDLDAHGNPLPDENGVGWVYLTMGDFRRARAASNIGQNEGDKG